jgi:CRP/FNR family transcriptional regulator, cyclic AMP receptor protein
MADKSKAEMLRGVPLFARCKEASIGLIERLADEVDVADGYVLMRQGELGHEFFLIIDGHVRIDRDGQTLATLGPGDYVGEIALIEEGRRTATATTVGPTKLFVIDHRGFNSLMDSSAEVRAAILGELVSRVRRFQPNLFG